MTSTASSPEDKATAKFAACHNKNGKRVSRAALFSRLRAAKPRVAKVGLRPWWMQPLEAVSAWLLSPTFRVALQLGLGLLWSGIFTVVRQIKFPEACIGAIFLLAALTLLSPDINMGCQLRAAAFILFSLAYSMPYAGSIVSLARTPGSAFAGTLVVFAVIGQIPIAALRGAPAGVGPGMIFALMYGVGCIESVTVWPARVLWREVVANLMAAMAVAGAGVIIVSTLVLPTLAGDELRKSVCYSLQGMGHQMSWYASALCASRDDRHMMEKGSADQKAAEGEQPHLPTLRITSLIEQMEIPEDRECLDRYMDIIRERTNPDRPVADPDALHPHTSISDLRASLAKAKAYIAEAEFEPAFLQAGPQDAAAWAKLVADVQNLLTRIASLRLLIEGGQLLHSHILLEMCEHDPLPSFKLMFAELAYACAAMGQAVKAAGSPKVTSLLTAIPWHIIGDQLNDCLETVNAGYWKRHKRQGGTHKLNSPDFLEIRVVLFLGTLLQGIIDALAAVEVSVATALGYLVQDLRPRDDQQGKLQAGNPKANGIEKVQRKPSHGADANGSDDRQGSHKAASTSEGDVKLDVKTDTGISIPHLPRGLRVRRNTAFLVKMGRVVSGYEPAMLLKKIFWDEAWRTFKSREELMITLKSRQVRYAFKFWFATSSVLTVSVCLISNFKNTRNWRLFYAYLTTVVVSIERVEAAFWKIVQRIIGTFIGGTLGYLIMLRKGIHEHGSAVLALVCGSAFVIANGLQTNFRYAVFLTMLTMLSLSLCQYPTCCRPGSDFDLWTARVVNIICGCVFSMSVGWLILPWYTSEEHLELLAGAYNASGQMMAESYAEFREVCKAATEDKEGVCSQVKLKSRLETDIVRRVEAVLLGLKRDTVLWSRGLFATPPVVLKLTREMRGLIHRMAALELVVAQQHTRHATTDYDPCIPLFWEPNLSRARTTQGNSPDRFGPGSASIYKTFVEPMHEPNQALMEAFGRMTEACQPILIDGWNPERAAAVESALEHVEQCRVALLLRFQQLRRNEHRAALEASDSSGRTLTAADAVKLGSWLIAGSKTFDKLMLIARLVASEGYRGRDDRFTSLLSLAWHEKHHNE